MVEQVVVEVVGEGGGASVMVELVELGDWWGRGGDVDMMICLTGGFGVVVVRVGLVSGGGGDLWVREGERERRGSECV